MTNIDFEKIVDTSNEWITTRTGIKERHIADADMTTSDMAVQAAMRAMEMARCEKEEIDLVICGTVTPDYRLPSNACLIQERLGLTNAVAFDVVAACTGFIKGLVIANSYIETGLHKKALIIGVEKLSAVTNYKDRTTCVLFGDGAGAVVVEPSSNGSGLISSFMKSDGRLWQLLWMKVGGVKNPYTTDFDYNGSDKIYMNGADVFKVAVKEMANAVENVLEKAGVASSDIALFVPHQANLRIIDALAKRLKIGPERVFKNIERYGNTSAASVPIALDEANRVGKIKSGDYVVVVAFGGGLIWGAALIKW